jgi:hypothetical protein
MAMTGGQVDAFYEAAVSLCAESTTIVTNIPASAVAERAGTELRLTSETLFKLSRNGLIRYHRAGTPEGSFVICPMREQSQEVDDERAGGEWPLPAS